MHTYIYIYLGQQTSRKKRLFWSVTLFLANWPILGQIGQFNPNDPKMAEIWLKSNFLCISMVSHPITSLSFTIATLVALIDPWRVWLDPWGLRFQAWAPAMLCLLFFAGVVHCSGIGCQLAEISMLYDTCCSDSGSQRFKDVPSETGVCLFACGTSRIQLFIWSYSPDLRQSCKTRMIHTYSRRRFGTATPRKTANRQFSSFSGPKLPRKSGAKTRNPHTKTRKRAQIRISALMCFDKMYFIAAKLGLNGKFFWFSKAGQPPADTPSGLIAGCIAVAILGMLFNTPGGSDSSSWGPVLRLRRGYRSAFQLGISFDDFLWYGPLTEAGGVSKTKITSEDVHGCHVHVTTCFLYSNTEVFVPLPAGIAEGWMIWCDVARDSTCGKNTWQKSWDRAEMAQTGQNYHYFLKRAENQNDQNLMVVWWYRYIV